jgi:hypothetical protein
MPNSEEQIAIQAIEKAIGKNQAAIGRLQRENGKFIDVLNVLRQDEPKAVDTEVVLEPARTVLGAIHVESHSDRNKTYMLKAWRIGDDLVVLTCDCQAFRYTTGDQWKGERQWCKHLRDNYMWLMSLPAVMRGVSGLAFRGGGWKRPFSPRA